jgi:uncharacterized phage-associated protein
MIVTMTAKCSALDVAKYILKKHGQMTAMKLQKLVYYCQAWSLVWDERPMFREKIKAWANGPVVPALFHALKGHFQVVSRDLQTGDVSSLDEKARETADAVFKFYGDKTAQWLSDLTHAEQPWIEARGGLCAGESGGNEIPIARMDEYYGSLKKN